MFTKGNKLGSLRKKTKHTDISKEKMKESHLLFFKNGGAVWNKGKKRPPFSEEWKKNMSIAMKGKKNGLGYKHSSDERIRMSESAKRRGIKPPSWAGKKHSLETIKKMGISQKGHPVAEHVREVLRQFHTGLTHTEETKRKMSEQRQGEKHPNWQGGKSFEPYAPEFNKRLKKQIRERDNYKCQECNFTQEKLGYTLSVHHIDYNKKNNSSDNLISLCKNCHSQTNFSRDDWQEYFKQKIQTL